jgi:alginate O-acetyltransferase complex protein AlgI
MPFTSLTFLFVFFPALFAAYCFCRSSRWRNPLLLVASLFFYAWGEGSYVALLILLIAVNLGLGLAIERARGTRRAPLVLAVAVTIDLSALLAFKYAGFAIQNVNAGLGLHGGAALRAPTWTLPAGVSFFTFMALSYLISVHRGETGADRSPVHLGLYLSLFPLTLAGPICRYRDLGPQLADHPGSLGEVAAGARRFVTGLGKKVLIANTLAVPANAIFALGGNELSAPVAWFGALCFGLQLYFDFAGYTDMAIGIGRMFGLRFMENFDYPYAARSIREFWRRWHISLSTWFRDYVFLPLAYPASRAFERLRGPRRRADFLAYTAATTATMLLIGLWHGASWSFVVWGGLHGAFLVAERTRLGRRLAKLPAPLQHAYALLAVLIGWVIFRSADLAQAMTFLGAMFGGGVHAGAPLGRFAENDALAAFAAALLFSAPVAPALRRRADALRARLRGWIGTVVEHGLVAGELLERVVVLVLSLAWLSGQTYTPFLYFRF